MVAHTAGVAQPAAFAAAAPSVPAAAPTAHFGSVDQQFAGSAAAPPPRSGRSPCLHGGLHHRLPPPPPTAGPSVVASSWSFLLCPTWTVSYRASCQHNAH